MNSLIYLLGSKSRAEIFRLLFDPIPGTEIYLRELQRQSGMSLSPIQEELAKSLKLGLVKVRKDGNRTYYSANMAHPLYLEIRGMVEKTTGLPILLKTALADSQIKIAFVFGSLAKGKEKPESDVDLFIIGDLGLRGVTKLLSGLADRIGREINPHTMTVEEFKKKMLGPRSFYFKYSGICETIYHR